MLIRSTRRPRSTAAIVVFALVYVAAMALLFAPQSFFGTKHGLAAAATSN